MTAATDILRREHRNITVVVRLAEETMHRLAAGNHVDLRDLPAMTHFFLRYADHLHHAKEEAVLFPALVQHDPGSARLLDGLLADHRQIRLVLTGLDEALRQGERDRYFDMIRSYLEIIFGHIARENEEVLPRADDLFSPEEQSRLADQLAILQNTQLLQDEFIELEHWHRGITGTPSLR